MTKWLLLSGYHANFIHNASAPPPPSQHLDPSSPEGDQERESRPLVMMVPYVAGMSEDIRHGRKKLEI